MIIPSRGGIAKALRAQGAELAFTYQGDALGKRVKPLAESLKRDTDPALRRRGHRQRRCDVRLRCKEQMGRRWISSVHAIGFSDKNELKGRYADTTRANFSRTMVISCFSFTEARQARGRHDAEAGGAMITLTFGGSTA